MVWDGCFQPYSLSAPVPLNLLYRLIIKVFVWCRNPRKATMSERLEATRALLDHSTTREAELRSRVFDLEQELCAVQKDPTRFFLTKDEVEDRKSRMTKAKHDENL
jgi:hypothetical protein